MNINTHYIEEKNKLEKEAGEAFSQMISRNKNNDLLVLLSGGSSLGLLEYISNDALSGGKITFAMLDDRFSLDQNINTYRILENSVFMQKVFDSGNDFLSSAPDEIDTLDSFALKYELMIKEWLSLYPNGKIIATVGVGPDGHTSGILPFPEDPNKFEALFNSEKLIVGYDVENKNPHRYRVTSTFTFMRRFDEVLTYIQGENKRDALQKVMADHGTLAETPGRILRELKKVELFTDIKL